MQTVFEGGKECVISYTHPRTASTYYLSPRRTCKAAIAACEGDCVCPCEFVGPCEFARSCCRVGSIAAETCRRREGGMEAGRGEEKREKRVGREEGMEGR